MVDQYALPRVHQCFGWFAGTHDEDAGQALRS